jgi:hypothetical protein
MALIETKSITTLADWSLAYVEDHVAAIYQEPTPMRQESRKLLLLPEDILRER